MSIELPRKRFYMLRHGESVANAEGYYAGAMDSPLTAKGVAQAQALLPLVGLLSPAPSCVFHSNLSRARDTAHVLNEALKLDMFERAALAERSLGDWAGLPWDVVRPRSLAGEVPPNGENEKDFIARVCIGLAEILSTCELPLIVAHGGIFDAIGWHYGTSIRGIENCTIYAFEPHDRVEPFPWDVWRCALDDNGSLQRAPAAHVKPRD